jgi:hypothetical protein
VLTTTVTADCLVTPYDPPANGYSLLDFVEFPQYSDQPQATIECCVAYHHTPKCIASSYYAPGDECSYLIRDSGSSGVGVSGVCPLGLQDFDFGVPDPDNGDILPGPCGY